MWPQLNQNHPDSPGGQRDQELRWQIANPKMKLSKAKSMMEQRD